jgi:hypothetical protein
MAMEYSKKFTYSTKSPKPAKKAAVAKMVSKKKKSGY